MKKLFLSIWSFLLWLPVSVGNHTHHSTGGGGGGGHSTHHSTTGGGSSGGGFIDGFGLISFLVVVAVIVIAGIVATVRAKKKGTVVGHAGGVLAIPKPPQNDQAVIAAIQSHDPNFSSERFLSWAEQVFCQLQEAWQERDWKKARPFESEELFNLHKSQLDEYIRNGTINMMENVCVNESYFIDYQSDAEHEYATVFMQTSYYDYIINEETKLVVRGDKNHHYFVNYKLKFMRSLAVKTDGMSNKSTHNCPNCGAPVDVNAAGQCAYCGTVITDGEHDWVLCNLDDCGQI